MGYMIFMQWSRWQDKVVSAMARILAQLPYGSVGILYINLYSPLYFTGEKP